MERLASDGIEPVAYLGVCPVFDSDTVDDRYNIQVKSLSEEAIRCLVTLDRPPGKRE